MRAQMMRTGARGKRNACFYRQKYGEHRVHKISAEHG